MKKSKAKLVRTQLLAQSSFLERDAGGRHRGIFWVIPGYGVI
jgi:hypothetical protein